MEYYGFLHFTVNTFTDKEWGYGDEDPAIFNPSAMDIRQWARVARDAGMKGLIITAKHHDGFCLWPSAYTEHSVKHSPWKNGRGDIVGELAAACREYGLRMGVYLSPWDRNSAVYGTPEYLTYYRSQLRELLTTYGDIFSVWYDGANGGDGYYGGANERRRIDGKTYYRWPEVHKLVRELQPMAVMFSDAGPDIRWVGNERGFGNETNYATLKRDELYPGTPRSRELPQGHRDGNYWVPYRSVGMGCNLLLNVPPDRRGLIHEADVASLMALRKVLDLTFDEDLAQDKSAQASNVRGGDTRFAASKLTDGDRETYWATDDNVHEAEATVESASRNTSPWASGSKALPSMPASTAPGSRSPKGRRSVHAGFCGSRASSPTACACVSRVQGPARPSRRWNSIGRRLARIDGDGGRCLPYEILPNADHRHRWPTS